MAVLGFDMRAFERELAELGLDSRQSHGVLCTVRTLSAQRKVAMGKAAIVALLCIQCFAIVVLPLLLLPS